MGIRNSFNLIWLFVVLAFEGQAYGAADSCPVINGTVDSSATSMASQGLILLKTIQAVDCDQLAVAKGWATKKNITVGGKVVPWLSPAVPAMKWDAATGAPFPSCKSAQTVAGKAWEAASLGVSCPLSSMAGVFVDGAWGDASFLIQGAAFLAKEGTRGIVGGIPFVGDDIVHYFGGQTHSEMTADVSKEFGAAITATSGYLTTAAGLDKVRIGYCAAINPQFKDAMNVQAMAAFSQWLINMSPKAATSIRETPCNEMATQMCRIGGMIGYELLSDLIWEAGAVALGVGGLATAGTTTVVGLGVAAVPVVKSLLKLAKKSVEAFVELLRFLRKLVPEESIAALLKALEAGLPPTTMARARELLGVSSDAAVAVTKKVEPTSLRATTGGGAVSDLAQYGPVKVKAQLGVLTAADAKKMSDTALKQGEDMGATLVPSDVPAVVEHEGQALFSGGKPDPGQPRFQTYEVTQVVPNPDRAGPLDAALTHPELPRYLEYLKSQGVKVIVDPSLPVDKGFSSTWGVFSKELGVIRIRPDTDFRYFAHEFEHLRFAEMDKMIGYEGLLAHSKAGTLTDFLKTNEGFIAELRKRGYNVDHLIESAGKQLPAHGANEGLAVARETELLTQAGYRSVGLERLDRKSYAIEEQIKSLVKIKKADRTAKQQSLLRQLRAERMITNPVVLTSYGFAAVGAATFATAGVAAVAYYYNESNGSYILRRSDGTLQEVKEADVIKAMEGHSDELDTLDAKTPIPPSSPQ